MDWLRQAYCDRKIHENTATHEDLVPFWLIEGYEIECFDGIESDQWIEVFE
jgi:hypothetical protein